MDSLAATHAMIRRSHLDLVAATERSPYSNDKQIAVDCAGWIGDRWLHPEIDVVAARVHLGAHFPEERSHDDRGRIFYCLAWMKGLYAQTEARSGRGRCDVLISTFDGQPLVVIEVKSDATAPAAGQVARYRDCHPGALAVVTATRFPPKLVARAAELDVQLLTGQQVVELLEDLAVWNLWREPRHLPVTIEQAA